MSSIATLPSLYLASVTFSQNPTEREIDRRVLLEIAPDREEVLMSRMSIEEIRQVLKIRTGPTAGHWLYHSKKRLTDVNLRDATARTSTLLGRSNSENNSADNETDVALQVLPTASPALTLRGNPLANMENRVAAVLGGDNGITVWGSFVVTDANQLISPRPLGPTHILVLHTDPLSVSKSGKATLPRSAKPHFPHMEIAINDLLFTLNVPNLLTVEGHSPLPSRLPKELPRALLRVPHLETFHELIVYFHNRNQMELFRKLVPEWIRDLLQPLPPSGSATPARPTRLDPAIFSPKKQRSYRSLFSLLSSGSSGSSTYSLDTLSSGMSSHSSVSEASSVLDRTVDSVGQEIFETLQAVVDKDSSEDPLVATTTLLNALKQNLEFVGYHGKSVWDELEITREVLIRALVWKSKLTSETTDT
ncbi:hypothetical protein B0H10DRAFT_1942715 [Mycena sp. CBHHK59/15]|nr:hypothetical protein B0H10DRAFT_1942715 [Mycena sp. CBHHK59/15]